VAFATLVGLPLAGQVTFLYITLLSLYCFGRLHFLHQRLGHVTYDFWSCAISHVSFRTRIASSLRHKI
jgi:hypothetical protein